MEVFFILSKTSKYSIFQSNLKLTFQVIENILKFVVNFEYLIL